MKKPFIVLANCPIRIVKEAGSREEGEKWISKNRLRFEGSLCVIENKPLRCRAHRTVER
jgi:hypothetical protein